MSWFWSGKIKKKILRPTNDSLQGSLMVEMIMASNYSSTLRKLTNEMEIIKDDPCMMQ